MRGLEAAAGNADPGGATPVAPPPGRATGSRRLPAGLGRVSPAEAALLGGVLILALSAGVAGLLLPTGVPDGRAEPTALRFGLAVVVALLAQAAQLRFRIGPGVIAVAWGEAAMIVGLYLVPPGWLPAATFLGVLLGRLPSMISQRFRGYALVHIAGLVTLAATVAAAAVSALARPYDTGLTLRIAGAYLVGAVLHLAVTLVLTALTGRLRYRLPFTETLLASLRGKTLMFAGNLAVSLPAIALVQMDQWWLLLVLPALWLLHHTYADRLRAGGQRRTWQLFAAATRALNQLDERAVAQAGIRGTVLLFAPERVEIEVLRPDGVRWRYQAGREDDLTDFEVGQAAAPVTDPCTANRGLVVGGVVIGDLRLYFPRPAQVALNPTDQHALSAFSDALAAALHDAATHRELRVMAARSSYEALHDPLTGLINRAALLTRGDVALRALDWNAPVALLLLDVDNFKAVNDTLGHAAGDTLLQTAAARLSALATDGELLARLGGDEFALMLPGLPVTAETDSASTAELTTAPAALLYAVGRARELTTQLATPTEVAGVRLVVEASVGVVVAPAGSADMIELLRRADVAMYQAKHGGASVEWYDGANDEASTDRLALLAELRDALTSNDQLVLALQPVVSLSTGAPTGVEALIRWRHPRRGLLPPGEFVRAVEDSELLAPFTRYVIDKALAAAAEWNAHGVSVPVAVNLSARNLLDPELPGDVAELLRTHRLPPARLVVEITETVVMSDCEVVDEVLAALRGLGVQIAVDDFGTGYSSLTFLTRIAVDEVKVDRTFVGRMADSVEAAAIVRTTVDLARELGLRVVAEGVETNDQRIALAALGCGSGQGFHFSRPMPVERVVGVLRNLADNAEQAKVVPLRVDGVS